VRAGDIAAAVGLKDVITGDTLCDLDKIITLEKMSSPRRSSRWRWSQDQGRPGKMGLALQRLAKEDPHSVSTPTRSRADDHLRHGRAAPGDLVDRMKREFKVEANVGKPQVAYRETFAPRSRARARFIRQSGGRGQYGPCG